MATNVSTFQELRDAIEDSYTTDILVTNDITFSSGGAKVNPSKGDLTIDFGNHTITGYNSINFTDTIFVSSGASEVTVTIKNAVFNGFNYYGIVGVYDGNTLVTVAFDNVNYKGPQFVYNKNGITKINNCQVVIDKNGSSTTAQEFCEANRVIISGSVIVNLNTTSNAVIWFTNANASLTVEASAYFEVNALSTYFLYTDSSPTLLFKKNSRTFITTKNGLFYASGSGSHIASSVTLEEGATFSSTRNEASSVPMFKCLSDFTIGKDATFTLYSPKEGSSALLYFGKTANLNIFSPKNIILYNNGGNIFSFQTGSASSPNLINIETEMMRFWSVASTPLSTAGGFNDTPSSAYHKIYYTENFTANFKLSNSQILSVDSTLANGDEGYPLSSSTPLLTSKVIAMGNIPLYLDEITDSSTAISGESGASVNLRATFDSKTLTGRSNSKGSFSITLDQRLTVGTIVTVEANKNFLTKSLDVLSEGSLSITRLEKLNFYSFSTPLNTDIVYRINDDWSLEVTDTRLYGDNWYLYAYILAPLTSDSDTLDDALVFKKGGDSHILSSTPILVYTGSRNADQTSTEVSWDKIEGFLLQIDPNKAHSEGTYSTEILWKVEAYPL